MPLAPSEADRRTLRSSELTPEQLAQVDEFTTTLRRHLDFAP
ncbi:hypothetical protein [Promicromonospora soli]